MSRNFVLPFLFVFLIGAGDFVWSQSISPPGSISEETPESAQAPLLVGITVHNRTVTTDNEIAQRYFDQGLNLMFAFNHDEAIRSFKEALRNDPDCAIAWWGIAVCHGPHINNPLMDEQRSRDAWEALSMAKEKFAGAAPVERALIEALGERYVADAEENIAQREALNLRYADAMRKVQQEFPDDSDVATLTAEALMDLRPWDLWEINGTPRPETPEVVALLEDVMKRHENHPGANHLYIHAVEASSSPRDALDAADRLRTLMPGSGHMVHMPAHIDVRTGKWALAADQNEAAMKIDAEYQKSSPEQGFYKVYMLHNPHFLAFTCMMEGRQERGLNAAREMLGAIPPGILAQNPAMVDPYMAIEYQVLIRFGQWDQVLQLPAPHEDLPITTAMWRFARATALAAKGEIDDAENEQALFNEAAAAVPEDAMGAINPAHDIFRVAGHALNGEIAFQKGDFDTAISELKEGVAAEESLLYMEPPEWIQPVRHSLGAVLVKAERWDEAAQVYRDDLEVWPENGWSLYGLQTCLKAIGDDVLAAEVEGRFKTAWARADTPIDATCLCVSGKK